MKTCTRCGESKSFNEFVKNSNRQDGIASSCKACQSEYARLHRKTSSADRARKDANTVAFVKKNRSHVLEYLRLHPCVDCGNDDIRVLEFDHRDESSKEFSIANKLRTYGWTRLLAEIEKCDVRCANCHRIRTGIQFGTWRSLV